MRPVAKRNVPWAMQGEGRSRVRISSQDIVAENLRAMGIDETHGEDVVERAITDLVTEMKTPCTFADIVDRTGLIPSTAGGRVQRLLLEGKVLRVKRGYYIPRVVGR